jgi:hypothetical protein
MGGVTCSRPSPLRRRRAGGATARHAGGVDRRHLGVPDRGRLQPDADLYGARSPHRPHDPRRPDALSPPYQRSIPVQARLHRASRRVILPAGPQGMRARTVPRPGRVGSQGAQLLTNGESVTSLSTRLLTSPLRQHAPPNLVCLRCRSDDPRPCRASGASATKCRILGARGGQLVVRGDLNPRDPRVTRPSTIGEPGPVFACNYRTLQGRPVSLGPRQFVVNPLSSERRCAQGSDPCDVQRSQSWSARRQPRLRSNPSALNARWAGTRCTAKFAMRGPHAWKTPPNPDPP